MLVLGPGHFGLKSVDFGNMIDVSPAFVRCIIRTGIWNVVQAYHENHVRPEPNSKKTLNGVVPDVMQAIGIIDCDWIPNTEESRAITEQTAILAAQVCANLIDCMEFATGAERGVC